LVGAFERASGKQLQSWADAYIKRRGMPQVDVEWTCNTSAGAINLEGTRFVPPSQTRSGTQVSLTQRDVLSEGGSWPIATQVMLKYGLKEQILRIEWKAGSTSFLAFQGEKCPDWIFANDQDYAYGRFLLDPRSRKAVMQQLGSITDVFERTLLWGSLWDSV